MAKRGREDPLTVEDGISAAKAILALATGDFYKSKATDLPYPGIGTPSGRPPVGLLYIGSLFIYELLCEFVQPKKPRVLIEGPRGFGKSCDLRALSCILYKDFTRNKRKDRLVCIWNMDAAVDNVVKVVQDALLFAFITKWQGDAVEWTGKQGSEQDESDEEEEQQALVEVVQQARVAVRLAEGKDLEGQIKRISSIDDAIKFVQERKLREGEIFHFFADGWEVLDTDDSHQQLRSRRLQRQKVQTVLDGLFSEGQSVWLAAFAKSTVVKEKRKDTAVLTKSKPFNQVQYSLYTGITILGKLQGLRDEDISYYTGWVPWLLDILTECCKAFPQQREVDAKVALISQVEIDGCPQLDRLRVGLSQLSSSVDEDELPQLLLRNDDDWATVLRLFREHEDLRQVNQMIDKIQLEPQEQCRDFSEMGKKDRTFFIVEENRYCSGFIARMYIHGFRLKEQQARQHARGVWIPYCQYLLSRPDGVNWSDMGWLIEDLVADVITHRTVFLGALGSLTGLKLEEFTEIPGRLIREFLKQQPGSNVYFKPQLFSIPYMDGVIIYRDMEGCLHIAPVQVRTSMDKHLASAVLFMSIRNLKRWFLDLEDYIKTSTSTSTGKGRVAAPGRNVELHFVYIGCSKQLGDEVSEEDKAAQVKELRGGRSCGVAAYKQSYVPLHMAMGVAGGLNPQELSVVEEIAAQRRLKELPKVAASMMCLMQLAKQELIDVGADFGLQLDPKLKEEDMINKLEAVWAA